MTAGEHLVSLSGLGAATAAQHLLAIVAGGAATTIFATQMTLRVSTPETVVATRAKRSARAAETPRPAREAPTRKTAVVVTAPIASTAILTITEPIAVKTGEAVKTVRNDLLSTFTKTR